jgi:hypothetical protein
VYIGEDFEMGIRSFQRAWKHHKLGLQRCSEAQITVILKDALVLIATHAVRIKALQDLQCMRFAAFPARPRLEYVHELGHIANVL